MRAAVRHSLIALVAVAISASGASGVRASCGDWLAGHDSILTPNPIVVPGSTASSLLLNDQHSERLAGLISSEPVKEPVRGHCRGPACGRSKDIPLTPPRVPVRLDRDQSACVTERLLCNTTSGLAWRIGESALLSSQTHTQRIDRPPQSAL